uniref:Uncharacterized protein n=1 Tax=Anguilla anguilla TaxID=7936 RepID=A0A0E9UB16_ANGAN
MLAEHTSGTVQFLKKISLDAFFFCINENTYAVKCPMFTQLLTECMCVRWEHSVRCKS